MKEEAQRCHLISKYNTKVTFFRRSVPDRFEQITASSFTGVIDSALAKHGLAQIFAGRTASFGFTKVYANSRD